MKGYHICTWICFTYPMGHIVTVRSLAESDGKYRCYGETNNTMVPFLPSARCYVRLCQWLHVCLIFPLLLNVIYVSIIRYCLCQAAVISTYFIWFYWQPPPYPASNSNHPYHPIFLVGLSEDLSPLALFLPTSPPLCLTEETEWVPF